MNLHSVKKFDEKHHETLLVLVTKKGKDSVVSGNKNKEVLELLKALQEKKSFTAGASESLLVREAPVTDFSNILFVGLGEPSEWTLEGFRRSIASAYRQMESAKLTHVGICKDALGAVAKNHVDLGQALAESLELASYAFDELKTKGPKRTPISFQIVANANLEKGIKRGSIIGEAVNFSRRLGDTPANLLTPTELANSAARGAKGTKLKVQIWNKERIKKEKMGLLLGVAQGSSQEPKVVYMEYKGAGAKVKPICLVGKGLTFDSGGISIKPSAGMEEMKFDMCGGANVIGTMLSIARLGLKINAIALVGCTENMPGPSATKPGDVHTARNGKTVEVTNTDAEGRLVLSDLLCYAVEQEPAAIIEASTLTGAMVVALGDLHTGFYTTNEKLAKKVNEALAVSGEWGWRMPVTKEHAGDMKGNYSDLNNSSMSRKAGSAQAAAFLNEFVPEGIPFAHFDIAGTAWNCANRIPYYRNPGATGVMIRTFLSWAENWK